MCGLYSMTRAAEAVRHFFDVDDLVDYPPRFKVSPGTDGLVIRHIADERRGDLLRWAFRPPWWSKPGSLPPNATVEKLFSSGAWKQSAQRRRCVIVADGFFEPEGPKKNNAKRPQHYFHRQDGELLAIAGLWTPSKTATGEAYEGCAIVTCEPGSIVGGIHSRSPLMLSAANVDAWLDPKNQDQASVQPMLQPAEPALLSHRVTDAVYKLRPDDPDCVLVNQ